MLSDVVVDYIADFLVGDTVRVWHAQDVSVASYFH